MEEILALMIPITFVIIVGLTTKWLSDNRVRRELVLAKAASEVVESVMASPPENGESSLKWGIVAVAVGLALVGIQLLHLDADDPVTFGIVFIFGGAGLLLFYLIKTKKDSR